jgi:hypothetical protein
MMDDCAQDLASTPQQEANIPAPEQPQITEQKKEIEDPLLALDAEFQNTLKNVLGEGGNNEECMQGIEKMLKNL